MAVISQRTLERHLIAGLNGANTTAQGRALESLTCYLFEKLSGITVSRINTLNAFNSEEIDVAFWNDKHSKGVLFLPDVILVECKNWSTPVSSAEVAWFDTKLRNRGLDFGILIAANGITGDADSISAAHNVISTALSESRRMIILTNSEILALQCTDQLIKLFKEKICDLAVAGTILN